MLPDSQFQEVELFPFYKARSQRFREGHNSPKVIQDSHMEMSSESRGTNWQAWEGNTQAYGP